MLGFYLALIDEPSDKEKFAEIYNSYKAMMYDRAMSILHNNSLAEDALQESFLKIAKNISKISDPKCSKTTSFIIIIVRNTCYDILRNEKFDNTIQIDSEDCIMPDIEDVFSQFGVGRIAEIIDGLDEKYRDALILKYLHGYSYKEIADLLDITQKNAEIRVYRARTLLKERLEDNGYVVE